MKQIVPWIPGDTLESARAARPVADTISVWIDSWFSSGQWSPAAEFQHAGASDWQVLRQEAAFQLSAKPKAMLALALAIIGQKARTDPTDIDLRLLRRLAGRAIDDLAARLDAVFPARSDPYEVTGKSQWQLAIGPAGQPLFSVSIDEAMLTLIARRSFVPARKTQPLAALRKAVEDIEVPLSAHIGSARLSIEQIDALEIGDLLLLDEHAGTPAQLTVAGRASGLRFTIGDTDDRLTLIMQEQ